MSEADRAYEAALEEIARVKAKKRRRGVLQLSGRGFGADPRFRYLADIPEEVCQLAEMTNLDLSYTNIENLEALRCLTALRTLNLCGTPVDDLDPLRDMTHLENLVLSETKVKHLEPLRSLNTLKQLSLTQTAIVDLAPLRNLKSLIILRLDGTQVADIGPLKDLSSLVELALDQTAVADLRPVASADPLFGKAIDVNGLTFTDTPATMASPELARLSIPTILQRRETQSFLKSLPPYPEPLPWDVPESDPASAAPEPPPLDSMPQLVLTAAHRIDVAYSPTTEADLADPIKQKLYHRLPEALDALIRFGNRFVDVVGPAQELRGLCSVPFPEADMLDIHLAMAALSDIEQGNSARDKAERVEPECLAAIKGVTRLGPPITMGHPDVELFEARSVEYARVRRMATIAEGERQVAAGLARAETIATERARRHAEFVSGAGDIGRVADYRTSFVRNAIISLSTVSAYFAGAVVDATVGEPVRQAAQFLILHKDAIMAIAPAWGEQGGYWAGDLIARAFALLKHLKDEK